MRIAYSFFSASVSERLATSAIARSSQRPASIPARAWSPASETVSGQSGVIVYGSSCRARVRRRTPAEALPKPYTRAVSTSPVWILIHAS